MAYDKKTTEEIISNIKLNIVTNVDMINDLNIGSGLDIFITAMGQELSEQYEDLDIIYNACRISTAEGTDLEEIGLIVGVERNIGEQAAGIVTFSRNSSSATDILISSGSIVATQPNTTQEQYQFTTTEDKTLYAEITDEEHKFTDGIYYYKLNSRLVDSVQSLDGTLSSSSHMFIQGIDYEIVNDYNDVIININDIILINDCDTAGDWTTSGTAGTPTANNTTYLEGTQSLNVIKSLTSGTNSSYLYTYPTTVDMTLKSLIINVYINNQTMLDKLNRFVFYAGEDSTYTNRYGQTKLKKDCKIGWNKLILDRKDSAVFGNPDYTAIKYFKLLIATENASDTIVAGELMFDFVYISTYEQYEGDVIHFIQSGDNPDNGTNFEVDYKPLSVDISCIGSNVGDSYNVGKGQITYKVSSLPTIDRLYNYKAFTGGVDKESDVEYRERIKTAGDLIDVSTVSAIKANVLNLSFVKTCIVNDLPLKEQYDESHVYNSTTKIFSLNHKVPQDDSNLIICDTTAGTASYVNGTDYILTDEGEIDFNLGGSEPTNGATVYANYNYKKLGYFEVFATGLLGELNSFELDEIENVVIEKKAAGTSYEIKQPSYLDITVNINITKEVSADETTVKNNVKNVIKTYINKLDIGDDVLIAGIIDKVMAVNGVTNSAVTDIGSGGANDYIITNEQKAVSSTITVSFI